MNATINAPSAAERAAIPSAPAGKIILTKRELSKALPMPVRTIEKLVSNGSIGALKITPRMIRFELNTVLSDLRRFRTATLK